MMTRVRISFEMDVFDYPDRNPIHWDWEHILEDDSIDIPDWDTLKVEAIND